MRKGLAILTCVLSMNSGLALAASGAAAALAGSPFAQFTEEDFALFLENARKAAVAPVDSPKVTWANKKSGAKGSIRPTRDFVRGAAPCRELRGKNTARGRTEPFRVTLCKNESGVWGLAENDPAQPATVPAATPTAPLAHAAPGP